MLIKKSDFIMPYFVIEGKRKVEPIISMPGIARQTIDNLLKDIGELRTLGIKKALLFGVCSPKYKDEKASYAYSLEDIVPGAVAAIKREFKDIVVITDVCLCAYTSHGHCGILKGRRPKAEGRRRFIDHEKTLQALAKIARTHAQAGADWVAPSAMAKGQVGAIRRTLDKNGFGRTRIMGYSAKFASNFYGPFRDAAHSAPKFGDRRMYQLDYRDARAALNEIAQDIKEGANAVMVKPALSYLDIISKARQELQKLLITSLRGSVATEAISKRDCTACCEPVKSGLLRHFVPRNDGRSNRLRPPRNDLPLLAAYNVSGEYAIVKSGARQGWWDEKKMVMEIITSIKRAGADLIITYHAKDIARWLNAGTA